MAGEGNLKCSFSAWALARFFFTYDFPALAALCTKQPFVSRGDDLSGRGAGWKSSFLLGKTSLCLFSDLRAWPGAVEMGPLSSRGALEAPGFSLADSAHSKDPFLFSKENSYAKHLAGAGGRSQPNWRSGGVFMAGPVLGAIPSFVC